MATDKTFRKIPYFSTFSILNSYFQNFHPFWLNETVVAYVDLDSISKRREWEGRQWWRPLLLPPRSLSRHPPSTDAGGSCALPTDGPYSTGSPIATMTSVLPPLPLKMKFLLCKLSRIFSVQCKFGFWLDLYCGSWTICWASGSTGYGREWPSLGAGKLPFPVFQFSFSFFIFDAQLFSWKRWRLGRL